MDDYYDIPETSGYSFEERVGEPEPCDAAIGRVVVSFNLLSQSIATAASKCADLDQTLVDMIPNDPKSAFLANVRFISQAVRRLSGKLTFNTGTEDSVVVWACLAAHCHRSEEMWQATLKLDWSQLARAHRPSLTDVIPGPGNVTFVVRRNRLEAAQILDYADYMLNTSALVDEFFLLP